MEPLSEIHDWGADLSQTAAIAKAAILLGARADLNSPTYLKVADSKRTKSTWQTSWDPKITAIDQAYGRYEPSFRIEWEEDGYWELESCGTAFGWYLDRKNEYDREPDIVQLTVEDVPRGERNFRKPANLRLPLGVGFEPIAAADLDASQRRGYEDLALLEDEALLVVNSRLNAQTLGALTSRPGALVGAETAQVADILLRHHPYPDDYREAQMRRWRSEANGRRTTASHDELFIESVAYTAATRYALTAMRGLETLPADAVLQLRSEVADSPAAYTDLVRALGTRAVQVVGGSRADIEPHLAPILWDLDSAYDDLRRAIKSSRVGKVAKSALNPFAGGLGGLALTFTAGVVTGGSPVALAASALAVPVAQSVRVVLDWRAGKRGLRRDPLYWRAELERRAAKAAPGRA